MENMDPLGKIPLFASLSPPERQQLANRAITRHYPAGDFIVLSDEIWPYLFWIQSGKVTAVKESYEGRSLVLTTIGAGEVFWGPAFFIDSAPMPAGLRAELDCELLLWSRQMMLPFLLKDGRLAWELAQKVMGRVLLASDIVEKLAFQSVAGRLAGFLLEQSEEKKSGPISRDLTLDEMAARVGSTREMVCRFLHRFASDGLIDITRTEFSLIDRPRLEELANSVKG
jgi:CRP/FNR family cyclic AMP-dependent transcriptional regulator